MDKKLSTNAFSNKHDGIISFSSFSLITLFTLCLLGCNNGNKVGNSTSESNAISNNGSETLKSIFADDFFIGTAISKSQIKESNSDVSSLIAKEFNAITPENDMKWEHIHPEESRYYFDVSDQFIALGEKYNMHTVGHTLLWHSQLAPWVSQIVDKQTLETQIEKHIATIAGRYKGKIHSWDVVNEALNEDGTPRESHFYEVFGDESYIELAFSSAAKADPNAQLIYNDYNLWKPEKRKGVERLVKNLKSKNIKIDAVGMQAHWGIEEPSITNIENSIIAYADLGVKVIFSELDVTVLPNPWELNGAAVEQNYNQYEGDPKFDPYKDGLSKSTQEQVNKRYQEIFKLFLKHKDKIDRVTFWGVHDGHSWLNNWPIKGRTNYPLLFNRDLQPKESYQKVLALKKE